MSSTTATRVIPKTVTLRLDNLSDAMKQLGLTGVSANTLVEATQQLESRESESTTTPMDGTNEVKSDRSRSEGMFMPAVAAECVQLAESESESTPKSSPKDRQAKLKRKPTFAIILFLSSGVEFYGSFYTACQV